MKKLTKKDLNELAKIMPVIAKEELCTYIGGYDANDCWWRCVAYVKSQGTSYSKDDAMALASGYYGSNFNENSYAFSGTRSDYNNYISGHVTNSDDYCMTKILVFDPTQISGWSGIAGTMHAVVVDNIIGDKMSVFDPQLNRYIEIDINQINASSGFYVNVRP